MSTTLTVLVATVTALAPQQEGLLIYPPEAFADYAPATAYDMVARVPGFQIQDGDARRGFAGAGGNVLIDGVRPNNKTESLEDLLKRIPARQVLRVEVRRTSDAASGGLGQTLLLNVVRVPLAISGVWAAGAETANRGQPAATGYAALSGRYGRTDYNLGLSTYSLRRDLPGDRNLYDSTGAPTGHVVDTSPRTYVQYAANGELGRDMLGGRIRLNGAMSHSLYADRSLAHVSAADGTPSGTDANPYSESYDRRENGLHYERGVGKGTLTLAALTTRQTFNSDIVSTSSAPDGVLWARYAQTLRRDAAEDIGRAAYSRSWSSRHRFDGGLEVARNSLDANAMVSLDLGEGPFDLHIPNANIRIEERRAEAFVSDTWTPATDWSVESRLALETSRLDFSGDTTAKVALTYLKPSLQVSRTLGPHQVRFKLARDAGQLDFNDFTSAAAFADGRINGGNPDLRPPVTLRTELAFDGRFRNTATLSVRLFHDQISDANDLVPVTLDGTVYDAPGNIGDARITGVQLIGHLPLGERIPGGRFDLDMTWQESRATDPVTGDARRLSKVPRSRLTAAFRQDIAQSPYAWGITYKATSQVWRYYAAEIDIQRDSPSFDAFAEAQLGKTLKLQVTAKSIIDNHQTRQRLFYDASRSADLARAEMRTARPGHWLHVTLSGIF